jgi:hypothetical protein
VNVLALQSDYPILSLTRLSAPVKVIEVPVIDIQVVEGIEGVVYDEEELVAPIIDEEEMIAGIVDEEDMVGVSETEGEITGSTEDEEDIIGVFED